MAITNSSSYTTGMEETKITEEICLKFPPKVISPGLASLLIETAKKRKILDYSGPRLHFQMIVIFVLTQIIHSLLKNLGLPLVVSQILAGMVLSPMIFNDENSLVNVSEDSVSILGTIGAVGFVFFLFLSGVKMDVSLTYKSGKNAICTGFLMVVVPLIFCLITDHVLHPEGDLFSNKRFLLAVSYSGTSFSVIHSLLSELKISNSELGRLGLAASLVGEIVTLVIMTFGIWIKIWIERGRKLFMMHAGLVMLFIIIVVFVLRPTMKWIVKRTREAGQIKDIGVYVIILVFLVSPIFTQLSRIYLLYGPFILGLAVPDGPPLGSVLVEKLDPVISGLFLPIFATTCGLRFDPYYIKHSSKFANHQAIAALVALITKFGVTLMLPMLCKVPIKDALAFAFIMISKGVVEMASYSIMNDIRIVSEDIFAHMTVMIILIASIVPILVKMLYDPSRKYLCFQKRTVMNSRNNPELRMISCIHVPSNVNSIINLLNASCPTKESSIALDVLHLIKLSGRATPIFIAHPKHKKIVSNKSYSENVVVAFDQFERDNWEVVSVNVFTAVSPPNLMYEDICNLAMDRLTSFIILPFHRRWYIDGSIESEDQSIRRLNLNILERAPCSVGIFVDGRRTLRSSYFKDTSSSVNHSSFNIAMIFLGGKDDREALALAKRLSQDESVCLTVIHLKAANNLGSSLAEHQQIIDDEMLREIKESVYFTYIEEHVNDGPETSDFLRSIVKDYQLIIVGRRYNIEDPQTAGLQEWCEFPEIGIIGDLLSSSDFVSHYSLLIVQRQQQRNA